MNDDEEACDFISVLLICFCVCVYVYVCSEMTGAVDRVAHLDDYPIQRWEMWLSARLTRLGQ